MENVSFNGWERCVRLANGEIELIVSRDVGPRILRCAFLGRANLFAEIAGQQGGMNEPEWMIRGGHRFWIAPESKPWSYEPDNVPYRSLVPIEGGIRTAQAPGPVTGLEKIMEIRLDPKANRVRVLHRLVNRNENPVRCAPWALSVMGPGTQAVIPLPEKIPHTERLTHNQHWSLWGYTDLSDSRWTIGKRALLLRQTVAGGPGKLGLAHAVGWAAALREGFLFVKGFDWDPRGVYPDGGCNLEVFTNEEFLELESLGPLVDLAPGASVSHVERWTLHRDVPTCRDEADVDRHVRPRIVTDCAKRIG